MPRSLITVSVLRDLAQRRITSVQLEPGWVVTDAAREEAQARGIALRPAPARDHAHDHRGLVLLTGRGDRTQLADVGDGGDIAAGTGPAPDPVRAEAVREAVIAQLGYRPPHLDAAIGAVLGDLR